MAAVTFTAGLVRAAAQYDSATLAASQSMEAKLAILGSKDAPPPYPAVVISENEANSYLKVHAAELLPKGIRSPVVKSTPDHVTVSADVDFTELSRNYPNQTDMGPKILAAMFKNGPQRVTVTGKIQSQAAGYLVTVESVTVGRSTLPAWLVDYVVQNVVLPQYKVDLSKPLPYPDHVKTIVVGAGQVTFLRGAH